MDLNPVPPLPVCEFSTDALARLDTAIATIQEILGPYIRLVDEEDLRELKEGEVRIGPEAFCRQTLLVLAANPDVLTSDFALEDVQWALRTFDALRWRLLRLRELLAGGETIAAQLAEFVAITARLGYGILACHGRHGTLEGLRPKKLIRRRDSGPNP